MGTGKGRWAAVVALVVASGFLCGGYCSYRGYYTPGAFSVSSKHTGQGPLSGFGSVFVEGDEYATGSATVTIDGVATTEASLLVGQVATVTGTPGSNGGAGTATTVNVTTKLVGPVTAVDLAAATVTVLGQTVDITGDTSVADGIAPTDPAGLLYGQIVAVDGYRNSAGLIASRFDAATGATLRVSGVVTALDGGSQTFLLGGTTVNWAGVAAGLPAGVTNGSYVVATGSTVGGLATLNALQVTAATEATAGPAGSSGTVHGAITRFAATTDFDVAGQSVTTDSSTTYVGGVAADLAADVEVQVAGQYSSAGALAATQVTIVPATVFRVVGTVDQLGTAAATLTVAGVTLATAAATRWDDRSALRQRTFAYADLRIGDGVEVRGVATGAAQADARVVERRVLPVTTLTELQDTVTVLADPALTIAGIAVDTRGATFSAVDGTSLTRAQFYADAAGHVVRVRGTITAGGAFVASTAALRN